MSIETRSGQKQQLAVRINGRLEPTAIGCEIQELVRHHRTLEKLKKPNSGYAVSADIARQDSQRVEDLCGKYGLPQDKEARNRSISGYDGKLRQIGFPYWRIKP